MNFAKVLMLLLLCLCSVTQAAELKKKDLLVLSQKADTIIKAMLDNQAAEYKKVRVYKRITNKYSREFEAVIFTIEGFNGGNNYHFYMALFDSPSQRFRLLDVIKIGAKTWRHVDFNSVVSTSDGIEIDTLEYQGSDANCCPSKKGKARFILTDNDRLIEVDPNSAAK